MKMCDATAQLRYDLLAVCFQCRKGIPQMVLGSPENEMVRYYCPWCGEKGMMPNAIAPELAAKYHVITEVEISGAV